jgi:hypothetical protein
LSILNRIIFGQKLHIDFNAEGVPHIARTSAGIKPGGSS